MFRWAMPEERDDVPEGLEITDVAIDDGDRVPDTDGTEPAGDPPVVLCPGLTLEVLPWEQQEAYMNAAERRGANFEPYRQFGQRYALVRRGGPGPLYQWDPDLLVQNALAMSRLIRDNGHDARYSVRVIEGFSSPEGSRQIMAGAGWEAWYVPDGERKWLSQAEAELLARLLQQRLAIEVFSARVENALWLAEFGARTPLAVVAGIWTVAALEALLNTHPYRLRRQFRERCQGLASELSVDGVTDDVTNRFYTARSEAVHGGLGGGDDQEPFLADLATMRRLLRTAVRRCIEETDVRAIFDSNNDVATKWPVSMK
jgi:hypothetical protein